MGSNYFPSTQIDEIVKQQAANYTLNFPNQKQNKKIDLATCNELETTFERYVFEGRGCNFIFFLCCNANFQRRCANNWSTRLTFCLFLNC